MIQVNHQPISTMSLSATSATSLKASGDGDYHFHGQPVECFFFPIKITLDGKSSAVLFERANSKLQNTIFHCSVHRQLCVFTNTEQKPTRCAHSYLHQCRCPAVATAEMHLSLCWHALFGFHSCLAGVGGIFSLRGGICFHTFPSYVLPCQTPFWQAAPLLPSTTQQQNAMGYRREVLFTKAD